MQKVQACESQKSSQSVRTENKNKSENKQSGRPAIEIYNMKEYTLEAPKDNHE